MPFTTETARWRALSIRDPTANGHFLYTVKTTNCYCRPTCPARLARRANIGFCKTADEAEAAGFRACKRCKPNAEMAPDPQEKAVTKACQLIDEAVERGDGKAGRLQELAKQVGLTPRYFHKVFKDRVGLSPKEYAKAKMQGARSGGADPVLNEGLDDLGLLNPEEFDFNDLLNFDIDGGLPTSTMPPSNQTELYTSGGFCENIDVNTQRPTMAEPWLDAISSGTSISDDMLLQQLNTDSLFEKSMMMTTTFEIDAALFLNAGMFPEAEGTL
jgi:methylphosphotriester-DNA--protein-cysteine methyltransferase